MRDDFDKLLAKHMQDTEFRAEYEALEPEYNLIQAMIDEKKCHISQEKSANRTGIN